MKFSTDNRWKIVKKSLKIVKIKFWNQKLERNLIDLFEEPLRATVEYIYKTRKSSRKIYNFYLFSDNEFQVFKMNDRNAHVDD